MGSRHIEAERCQSLGGEEGRVIDNQLCVVKLLGVTNGG